MEAKTQIVYTNWDPCNDVEMLGLQRMPFKEWVSNKSGIYLYAIDYRYNFNSKELKFANYDNVYILLDDTLEAYSYRSFKKVYNLVRQYKLENRVIYATGHLDGNREYENWLAYNDKIYNVYVMNNWYWRHRDWTIDCGNEVSVDKTKLYCCMQNRGREHRQATTIYLHQQNLLNDGIVSANFNLNLDCNLYNADLTTQKDFTDKILPLVVDIGGTGDKCYPNDLNPKIYNDTLINLVSETFYHEKTNNHVSEMFITEKTYKAFTAYQIPVIIGPKGIVEKLRSYGFDMFDDIIDHSYDNMEDSDRLFAAIDNLKTLQKRDIKWFSDKTKQRRIKNKELYLAGVNIDEKVTTCL